MRRTKAIQFVEFDNGCYVPLNVGLNADGYYRRIWSKENEREMFHRFVWRAHNGEIPAGHEVNHKCRNRGCCNPQHLEVLSKTEHLINTNRSRYAARKLSGKFDFLEGMSRREISEKYGVNFQTACNWANELGWESL